MTRTPRRPAPTRPRRSALPAALLTALIATGAVAGATAVFSGRTQQLTQDFSQRLTTTLNATGYVTARQTGYQKGFSSSTQTMTLTLKPEKTGLDKPLELLVTNHIKHGPFPGWQGVGQATVDTDIRFADPKIQAQFDKAFAGKKPIIHTLVGLAGDTHTTVEVPGGSVTEQEAVTSWQALAGHINVVGQRVTSEMQWPGLTMSSDGTKVGLSGVSFSGDTARSSADDQLGTGRSVFKIASLDINDQQESQQNIHLGNMEVSAVSRQATPGFYDSEVRYGLGQLTGSGLDLKNVQFQLGLRHLAREPLNNLVKFINQWQETAQANGTASDTASGLPDLTDAQTRQLESDLQALLKGSPRLTLDRLSLSQPSGDIVLTGEASAPQLAQLSAQDMQMLTKMPAMLAGMLQFRLEAQGKEQAVRELLSLIGNDTKAGDLNSAVQTMIDQGYLTRQGDSVKAVFEMKGGQALLNGQALGD